MAATLYVMPERKNQTPMSEYESSMRRLMRLVEMQEKALAIQRELLEELVRSREQRK